MKIIGKIPLELKVDEITTELTESGIPMVPSDGNGEYKDLPQGQLGNWRFRRNWFYWTANAPAGQGLPKEVAEKLYDDGYACTFRAGGYSGGGVPLDWVTSEAGTIDCYHINTLEDLKAFVNLIGR